MSYRKALEAAGAKVLAFAQFGDYSGEWLAKVSYNGETGYIQDWFGSCTFCDAFEKEFGYDYENEQDYDARLAAFGKRYLGTILPADHYLKMYREQDEQEYYLSDNHNQVYNWILGLERPS